MEADKKTTTEEAGFFKKYGFYLALAVLAVIVMLPNPEGLSVAGQRMIGIMVFSVIVWATTAISYPVSAGVIMTLMALLIGFAPNPETGKLFGTAAGLGIGLKGFASTAFCLVAAAMFLAVAMTKTGLDKRIALVILSKLGAKSNRVVIGVILCGFILSFFVPSTTARVDADDHCSSGRQRLERRHQNRRRAEYGGRKLYQQPAGSRYFLARLVCRRSSVLTADVHLPV